MIHGQIRPVDPTGGGVVITPLPGGGGNAGGGGNIGGGGVNIGGGGINIGPGGGVITLPGGGGGIFLPGGGNGGATSSGAVIVAQPGLVVGAAGTAAAAITGGQTPPIAAAGGTATQSPATYWWTISGGKIVGTNTGQTIEFTADTPGNVGLSVTVATDGTSYSATSTVTVVAANAAGAITMPATAASAATVSASVPAAKNNDRTFRWTASGDAAIASGGNSNSVSIRAGTPGVKEITCSVTLQNITTLALRSFLVVTGTGAPAEIVVQGGSGSGRYPAGSLVDIFAQPPAAGSIFDHWSGDTDSLGDAALAERSAHAVVTVPAAGARLTAVFRDTATWTPTTVNEFNPQQQTNTTTRTTSTITTKLVYYIPNDARGLVFLLHAEGGSATDWFSRAETLLLTRQLVAGGYGVAALSSVNTLAGTWATQTTLATNLDARNHAAALDKFVREGLLTATKPVFMLGEAGGADAAAQIGELLATSNPARPIRGVVLYDGTGSEQLSLTSRVPQLLFIAANDAVLGTAGMATARQNVQLMAGRGFAANVVNLDIAPLSADSLRSLAVATPEFGATDAQAVWNSLKAADLLDPNGYVKSVPTAETLKTIVPAAYQERVADVSSRMAVANASRALTSDTGVRVLEFLEARAASASAPQPARLVNLAMRGNVAFVGDSFTVGFTLSGTARATLLIRAVGPTLSRFRVSDPLAAPRLEVNRGTTVLAANEGWDQAGNTPAQISTAATGVGAFALPAGAKDAAVLLTLDPGNYTVVVKGVNGTTGDALAEIYDVSKNATRVTTFSALGRINEAGEILIPGFALQGNRGRTLLLRVVGPGLSDVGVPANSTLGNPRLTVFGPNNAAIAANDNWNQGNNAAALSAVFASSGAFPLRTTNGDSALVSIFNAGTYSAQATAAPVGPLQTTVPSATGAALVEIYEVP